MNTEFRIHGRVLKQLIAHTAPASDCRKELCGIHVVCDGTRAYLEATDGQRLMQWRVDSAGGPCNVIVRVPMPIAVAKTYLITIDPAANAAQIHVDERGEALHVLARKFPDTINLIATEPNGDPASFDAALIGRAATAVSELLKAQRIRSVGAMRLETNGTHPAKVSCRYLPQLTYLLMPLRDYRVRSVEVIA